MMDRPSSSAVLVKSLNTPSQDFISLLLFCSKHS